MLATGSFAALAIFVIGGSIWQSRIDIQYEKEHPGVWVHRTQSDLERLFFEMQWPH